MPSSISRSDLEAMNRDELVALIEEQDGRIDDLELRVEAYSRWKEATNEEIETLVDTVETLREENQTLRSRLDEIEATAEQAMAVASRGHNPDDRSQTELAAAVTRNVVVLRSLDETVEHPRVTIREIRDRARDLHGESLAWSIVDRAWDDLQAEWSQFERVTKSGEKALTLKDHGLTTSLVRTVEADLGRTDLTKQFVGATQEEGS